jgi:hypothetical protein
VGCIGRFSLSWAHSSLVAACIFGAGRVSLPQVVCSSFVEWESPLNGLLVDYLGGCVSFLWLAVFTAAGAACSLPCCVVCKGEAEVSRPPHSLVVLSIAEWISMELGLPFHPKLNSKTCIARVTLHQLVGVHFGSFWEAVRAVEAPYYHNRPLHRS